MSVWVNYPFKWMVYIYWHSWLLSRQPSWATGAARCQSLCWDKAVKSRTTLTNSEWVNILQRYRGAKHNLISKQTEVEKHNRVMKYTRLVVFWQLVCSVWAVKTFSALSISDCLFLGTWQKIKLWMIWTKQTLSKH